jgi:methionine-rich copper-binding protein CopC
MLLRTAVAALLLLGGASAVSARPVLQHATPAAGSMTRQAPPHVALSFTEALSAAGSDAVVRNATGGVVSSGKARVVGNKAQLQVPVNALPPGKYRVEWVATSTDRKQNQGSFTFIVGGKESTARASARTPQPQHHKRHKAVRD